MGYPAMVLVTVEIRCSHSCHRRAACCKKGLPWSMTSREAWHTWERSSLRERRRRRELVYCTLHDTHMHPPVTGREAPPHVMWEEMRDADMASRFVNTERRRPDSARSLGAQTSDVYMECSRCWHPQPRMDNMQD